MDKEKNEVRQQTLTSSAYILVDDNNILFFSLYGGIYRFDIEKMKSEFIGLLHECTKRRYKVRSVFNVNGRILVVFDNTYNIVEYDPQNNCEKLLTDISETPDHIVDVFLIDNKLWLFPYELKDSIMSFNIRDSYVKFYAIDEVITNRMKIPIDISESRLFHLSYGAEHVWTTLKADHYGIRFDFHDGLKAHIFNLTLGLKYAGIDYINGGLYLPVIWEERADRYNLDFQYVESISFDEGKLGKNICYRNISSCGEMLFAIPYTHEGIHYVNCRSGKKGKIDFPEGFRKNVLPFWKGILAGERLVLPSYYSNMLLVIERNGVDDISLRTVRIERDVREIRAWLNYMFQENEIWTLSKFIDELGLYPPNEILVSSSTGKKIYENITNQD